MTNQNIINIKQLSSELFIQPKSLRKKLRDNGIEKPGTRWEWPEDHETVATVRSWKDGNEPKAAPVIEEVAQVATEPSIERIIATSGNWTIFKGPEGVKAVYKTAKSQDSTKWMVTEEDIRPSLPKAIKELVKESL